MHPVIEMSESGFLQYLSEILFTLPDNKFVAIVSDGLEEFHLKNCINTNYKNIKPSVKGRGVDYLFLVNFDNFDKDIQSEICDAIFPTVVSRKDGKVFFIKLSNNYERTTNV